MLAHIMRTVYRCVSTEDLLIHIAICRLNRKLGVTEWKDRVSARYFAARDLLNQNVSNIATVRFFHSKLISR